MTYIIYKDGTEVNRIAADEEFCKKYYAKDGYSCEAYTPPAEPDPSVEPEQVRTELDLLAEAYREGVNEA